MPEAPRFSKRLPEHLRDNALSRAQADLVRRGAALLDLTESNPTRAGLAPEAAALRALADARGVLYQPSPLGLSEARAAVASYLKESGAAQVEPSRILLTASTSEAYALLFKLLCDPGDAVLVPEPSYPLFGYLAALESVRVVAYPLQFDGEWHVDPAALGAALANEPRARAILLVSPGNPTGNFLKECERDPIAELCRNRGCALVSDEVFADYPLRPVKGRMTSAAAHADVLSFTLSGLSKVCGLPQLKLGWCAISGPQKEVEGAVARLEVIADTYLSVGTPVQLAAPALLAGRHAFQRAVQKRLLLNRSTLAHGRSPGAPWDLLASEGGWSAILSVSRARSDEEWALALLEAGVRVHPGYFFDLPEGHLVLSLLPEEEIFAEGVRRLSSLLCS